MTTEDRFLESLRQELDREQRSLGEPYVVCWRDLDPAVAAEEVERLASWVDWIVQRYRIDHKSIPPCWAEHGALVEELSALHILWTACYLEDASPSDAVGFHRELDSALRRLREWSSRRGCTRTEHRPEPKDC
ncbi:hypothetical protein [Kribbella deserti]|uniref:DUF4254 domain-containing protein n=1 Tax=Kribbella deserti TaxID=1926257 RepID=A0ABV6QS49_9ACTN